MADQERRRTRRPAEEQSDEVDVTAPDEQVSTDEIDELLDEIDTVLEENAEEFVKNYVQKGGE